jgi:hypothetical protein
MAWQVVIGFSSLMVDVSETVLAWDLSMLVVVLDIIVPCDRTVRMLVVVISFGVLLPVTSMFACVSGGSVGKCL